MKTLGSLRRVDCVECEIVLASGVYLTFRLDTKKAALVRNLFEVQRTRLRMRPRESILVDAHTLQIARKAAFDAVMAHREKMRLPKPTPPRPLRPVQLRFVFH